jgi:guanine deaminase
MCLATALWARIGRVYFAADRNDAAAAGFDDARFYRYFDGLPEDRAILPVERIGLPADGHTAPFVAWGRNDRRIEY